MRLRSRTHASVVSILYKASDLLGHPGQHQALPGLVLTAIGSKGQSSGLIGATAYCCCIWLAQMTLLDRSFLLGACALMTKLGSLADMP